MFWLEEKNSVQIGHNRVGHSPCAAVSVSKNNHGIVERWWDVLLSNRITDVLLIPYYPIGQHVK